MRLGIYTLRITLLYCKLFQLYTSLHIFVSKLLVSQFSRKSQSHIVLAPNSDLPSYSWCSLHGLSHSVEVQEKPLSTALFQNDKKKKTSTELPCHVLMTPHEEALLISQLQVMNWSNLRRGRQEKVCANVSRVNKCTTVETHLIEVPDIYYTTNTIVQTVPSMGCAISGWAIYVLL